MVVKNYGDLKEWIASTLMRPDLEGEIPAFVQFATSGLNRVLRSTTNTERSTAQVSAPVVELPGDWLEARNIQISDGPALHYAPPEEMDTLRHNRRERGVPVEGRPSHYSIIGRSLELFPEPTEAAPVTLDMVYYAELPGFNDDQSTNWLLQRHPDLYTYGALIHAAPYLVDDQRIAVWETRYNRALTEFNEGQRRAQYSGATLKRGR